MYGALSQGYSAGPGGPRYTRYWMQAKEGSGLDIWLRSWEFDSPRGLSLAVAGLNDPSCAAVLRLYLYYQYLSVCTCLVNRKENREEWVRVELFCIMSGARTLSLLKSF